MTAPEKERIEISATKNSNNPSSTKEKFKGETEALHGHIYDVGVQNQAELFSNTTKKVAS